MLEREADYKSEYVDGEIFAMAAGSESHSLISANIIRELGNALRKRPCRVYSNDMRIKDPDANMYTYADAIVVCGKPELDTQAKGILLNPALIVEVLSGSTEAYVRGKKFEQYRRIPSFREYLVIAQDQCRIEQFSKQDDGRWLFSETHDLNSIVKLSSCEGELAAAEVYDKVEFES